MEYHDEDGVAIKTQLTQSKKSKENMTTFKLQKEDIPSEIFLSPAT